MKRSRSVIAGAVLAGAYLAMERTMKKRAENESIDDDNPYIEMVESTAPQSVYEGRVKPFLDKALSFAGMVAFSPLFGLLALAVYIDDPGSIFFTQKRVGKDGRYFMLHKYRTMKVSTPHDVPTHQLEDPEQYITRVGKVLRKTSLDEIPQAWDVFRGKMSCIGPRPALWNQDDLVAEREKYGANSVMPGLTGLAQIRGRDELEIPDKARVDGEYAETLRKGGLKAWMLEVKCFLGTVTSVLKHDGVVEGGTGSMSKPTHPDPSDDWQTKIANGLQPVKKSDVGFEDYGCHKTFHIDKKRHIKVLITGAGSYIGESFEKYVKKHYPNIETVTIDMVDGSWRDFDFSPFDTVFHVAGIAHADVGKVTEEEQKKYYEVNCDLAVETAKKCRNAGVKQFIFMSSMIIYGGAERIDEHTMPKPANFYGDSKWQGDKGVREIGDDEFKVAVLRPPMIYGKGSKGNYPQLSKIAKKAPAFPNINNRRSMLYIENLCEFVSLLALSGEGGIYFPQNGEYSNTSILVQRIGEAQGKRMHLSKALNTGVFLADHAPIKKVRNLATKAFGSSYYEQGLSKYQGLEYQKITLDETIRRTES